MTESLKSRVYLLPITLFVSLLVLFVLAGSYLHSEQQKLRRQKANSILAQSKAYLETLSNERTQALVYLMRSWPSYESNIEDWFNVQAQRLTSVQKGYSALVYANQKKRITWVYNPPNELARNRIDKSYIGQSLDSTNLLVHNDTQNFVTELVTESNANQTTHYLLIGRAISNQELEHGYLLASYNVNNILSVLLGDLIKSKSQIDNQFIVNLSDRDTLLFSSGTANVTDRTTATDRVQFIGRTFTLSIQTRQENPFLASSIILVGCLMSFVISWVLHKQLKNAARLSISQERFQAASDASLDALLIYRKYQQGLLLIEYNKLAKSLLGKAIPLRKSVPLATQMNAIEQSRIVDIANEVASTGEPFEEYIEIAIKNVQWIKIQIVKAGDDIAMTIRDVSRRFEAQKALKESEEKYRRLIDGLHQHFVYIKNPEQDFEYVSAGVKDILGLEPEEFCLNEASMRLLLSPEATEIRKGCDKNAQLQPYTVEYLSVESGTYVIEYSDTCVFNEQNELVAIEGIARDVTQELELQRKVNYQATHDQLTGLHNRFAFDQTLKTLLHDIKQTAETAVMCFIDMDRFKLVNDTCGHSAGDRLLKEVGHLFSQHVGERDTLARIGGDEFCMIFRRTNIEQVKPKLDLVLQEISAFRFAVDDQIFFIGASIGVIAIDEHHTNGNELVKAADNACYQAKYQGRNQYYIYQATESEINHSKEQTQVLSALQRALTDKGFALYCQCIQPLGNSNNSYQYEILIRMLNNKGELISPALFIPLAERHGLMNKLDWWVVDNTLCLLELNPSHLMKLEKVAINLSGLTLGDVNTLDRIVKRINESTIPANKLCFEITETEAVTNLGVAKHFITTLRELGCRFALDDFGVGMSSFSYLKQLDVDYVKIDGSFVRNIAKDHVDFETVKAINNLAHSMGKQTVAEFVGNEETTALLKTLNVDYGQGFALGKPVPLLNVLEDETMLKTT